MSNVEVTDLSKKMLEVACSMNRQNDVLTKKKLPFKIQSKHFKTKHRNYVISATNIFLMYHKSINHTQTG